MVHGPAQVNKVHASAPSGSEQLELFPAAPPRLVRLDGAPVLFPALAHAEYEPAGFLACLPNTEAA
jgi:hypothetical protein